MAVLKTITTESYNSFGKYSSQNMFNNDQGVKLSSATIFEHEVHHAKAYNNDPQGCRDRRSAPKHKSSETMVLFYDGIESSTARLFICSIHSFLSFSFRS